MRRWLHRMRVRLHNATMLASGEVGIIVIILLLWIAYTILIQWRYEPR